MAEATVNKLYEMGILSELDYRFARLIGRFDGRNSPEAPLAAALVSLRRGEGHICIDLDEFAGQFLNVPNTEPLQYPALNDWLKVIEQSPAVGGPGDYRPLVLDGSRLYLYRYWDYEKNLVDGLKNLAGKKTEAFDVAGLRKVLNDIFYPSGHTEEAGMDWQKCAAFAALRNRLCIISGGPGTGKTFTVAKILAVLTQHHGAGGYKIALAAPTGKAAARLQQAVKAAKGDLNCPEDVRRSIPDEASTIHRLLGSLPNSPYFRYNSRNRLSADCVVIDEASMIDLALFSKLLDALKDDARLILLGDKDQLASVEAGAVLGDICNTGRSHAYSLSFIEECRLATGESIVQEDSADTLHPIADCICELKKNYRFTETGGIGALSRAVNAGDVSQIMTILGKADFGDMTRKELPSPDRLPRSLEDWAVERYGACFSPSDPLTALDLHGRFRILCALRDGPYGVQNTNTMVEHLLIKKGLIRRTGTWYPGRPVMITKNDYHLRLFNGDIGIAMTDGAPGGGLKVFFAGVDGSVRSFLPLSLPEHETVYAMTVHKSQGSEFQDVLFVLTDRDVPILTRELIYTAVTRARNRIEIWGSTGLILAAAERKIQRSSGLRQALWGA